MTGLFQHRADDTNTPRLIATITEISEKEQSALSGSLEARYGNHGKVRRKMPCFVFDDHISESNHGRDFILTLSHGTAFIDTRASLSPGQKITMLFPEANDQGSMEIMGEVIWISSKAAAHY